MIRAVYLDEGRGRRLLSFVSVLVDRLSGLLVLLVLACVAVLFYPRALPPWIPWSVWITAACAALGLLTGPLLLRRTHRFERMRRLAQAAGSYRDKPLLVLETTALSFLVQAANVVLVWLVGQAIRAPVPLGLYWIVVPMVTLLTLLPVSLNGMGVREGGMILFLTPFGVPESTALSLAFLWFLVYTAVSLCGAAVYLFGNFNRPPEEPSHGFIGRDSDQGRTRELEAAA